MEDYDAAGVPRESQGRDDGLRWEARTILLERMVTVLPESAGAYSRTHTVSNCPNAESVQVEEACFLCASPAPETIRLSTHSIQPSQQCVISGIPVPYEADNTSIAHRPRAQFIRRPARRQLHFGVALQL